MTGGSGSWWFSGHHLDRSVERWRADHSPTDPQVSALYEWAMSVAESGPSDVWTMPTANAEEYVTLVPAAGAFVTYLAVVQDRSIFVQSIEPDLA
jgi:hypothetical protein